MDGSRLAQPDDTFATHRNGGAAASMIGSINRASHYVSDFGSSPGQPGLSLADCVVFRDTGGCLPRLWHLEYSSVARFKYYEYVLEVAQAALCLLL